MRTVRGLQQDIDRLKDVVVAALEKVQNRFTRMLPGTEGISYEERLETLGVVLTGTTEVEERPDRGLQDDEGHGQSGQTEAFSQGGRVRYRGATGLRCEGQGLKVMYEA
eukprot:g22006.t1